MAKVTVRNEHDLEKALKHLKRIIKQEGVLRECKERRHYVKPSERKRLDASKRKKR